MAGACWAETGRKNPHLGGHTGLHSPGIAAIPSGDACGHPALGDAGWCRARHRERLRPASGSPLPALRPGTGAGGPQAAGAAGRGEATGEGGAPLPPPATADTPRASLRLPPVLQAGSSDTRTLPSRCHGPLCALPGPRPRRCRSAVVSPRSSWSRSRHRDTHASPSLLLPALRGGTAQRAQRDTCPDPWPLPCGPTCRARSPGAPAEPASTPSCASSPCPARRGRSLARGEGTEAKPQPDGRFWPGSAVTRGLGLLRSRASGSPFVKWCWRPWRPSPGTPHALDPRAPWRVTEMTPGRTHSAGQSLEGTLVEPGWWLSAACLGSVPSGSRPSVALRPYQVGQADSGHRVFRDPTSPSGRGLGLSSPPLGRGGAHLNTPRPSSLPEDPGCTRRRQEMPIQELGRGLPSGLRRSPGRLHGGGSTSAGPAMPGRSGGRGRALRAARGGQGSSGSGPTRGRPARSPWPFACALSARTHEAGAITPSLPRGGN